MKIVILGAEARYRAYQPAMPFIQQQELVFLDKGQHGGRDSGRRR